MPTFCDGCAKIGHRSGLSDTALLVDYSNCSHESIINGWLAETSPLSLKMCAKKSDRCRYCMTPAALSLLLFPPLPAEMTAN